MRISVNRNGFSIFISSFLIILIFIAINFLWGQPNNYSGDKQKDFGKDSSIILLLHSTGGVIWKAGVTEWFKRYNSNNSTNYSISARAYPSGKPYPWENYPYDYWNIWVNHAGNQQYLQEDTLEILTSKYDIIIWKHCFPVSNINADTGKPDITSNKKTVENYKLQYNALKKKMHTFPNNRFIVWTGAANVQANISLDQAKRAKDFFNWVNNVWDEKGDNIYVWDFWQLETGGGLYLLPTYAASLSDSHPNSAFANTIAPYLSKRIIDIIHGNGDIGSKTGN